jgi:hypothetical protein
MRLVCRVVHAEPPAHFAFACDGDAGEHVREDVELAADRDGSGTRVTIQSDFDLGHAADPSSDPLSVIPELTYTQAWLDRSLEQAFAHLGALVDGSNGASRPAGDRSQVQSGPMPARGAGDQVGRND